MYRYIDIFKARENINVKTFQRENSTWPFSNELNAIHDNISPLRVLSSWRSNKKYIIFTLKYPKFDFDRVAPVIIRLTISESVPHDMSKDRSSNGEKSIDRTHCFCGSSSSRLNVSPVKDFGKKQIKLNK